MVRKIDKLGKKNRQAMGKWLGNLLIGLYFYS